MNDREDEIVTEANLYAEDRLKVKRNLKSALKKLHSALGANGVILGDNEVAALIECVEEWLELE